MAGHIPSCCMTCECPWLLPTVDVCRWLLLLLSPLLSGGLSPCPGNCPASGRTVQGMARVRSGQATAWPLVSDRSVRRGCGVKRDFACTFTRRFSPVLVARWSQSRLMLEGRARTLSGSSPDLSQATTLPPSGRSEDLLIRSSMCGHPDPFRSVRDLGLVAARCSCSSGLPKGCSPWWLPAWLPRRRVRGSGGRLCDLANLCDLPAWTRSLIRWAAKTIPGIFRTMVIPALRLAEDGPRPVRAGSGHEREA